LIEGKEDFEISPCSFLAGGVSGKISFGCERLMSLPPFIMADGGRISLKAVLAELFKVVLDTIVLKGIV
jgi:hypothetical protein